MSGAITFNRLALLTGTPYPDIGQCGSGNRCQMLIGFWFPDRTGVGSVGRGCGMQKSHEVEMRVIWQPEERVVSPFGGRGSRYLQDRPASVSALMSWAISLRGRIVTIWQWRTSLSTDAQRVPPETVSQTRSLPSSARISSTLRRGWRTTGRTDRMTIQGIQSENRLNLKEISRSRESWLGR